VIRLEIPGELAASRMVAILRRTAADLAVETAEALLRGGLTVIEMTWNTPGMLAMLRATRDALGDRILLGAGTILDADAADAALQAGARFIVSPHTDPALIRDMARRGIPCIPGAQTPTEVLTAWRAGAVVVKLFPAGALGAGYVRELRGPIGDVPLLPTGGVTLENASSFVAAGAWGLGVGSALVAPSLVAERRFDELTRRAADFVAIAAGARGRP
jgi:2-dehydro-3-deoxyphosphogluconate aldolase/(4S)-4-hydroxy-2-oxoglutarate aldolase